MLIRTIPGLAITALCLLAAGAHAEFYQYTDDRGVVHYTDYFLNVPEKYRSQIASHKDIPNETIETDSQNNRSTAKKEKKAQGTEVQKDDSKVDSDPASLKKTTAAPVKRKGAAECGI